MSTDLTTAAADRDQLRHCFGELRDVADGIEAWLDESLVDLGAIARCALISARPKSMLSMPSCSGN